MLKLFAALSSMFKRCI